MGGTWGVSLPFGTASAIPSRLEALTDVFGYVDDAEVIEPPAAYRLDGRLLPVAWDGEQYSWNRVSGPGVVELVDLTRPKNDAPGGGPWSVKIGFEIRR